MSKDIKASRNLELLPVVLKNILATAAADLIWSPRENKIMYTATASATIPNNLIRELPGSSTQTQDRNLKPGNIYIYDLEEDRNFELENEVYHWFSDSNHLMSVRDSKVTIVEYDGQNPTLVYSGPMESGFAGPYPSSKQILILTNLPGNPATKPNLYAVSLR